MKTKKKRSLQLKNSQRRSFLKYSLIAGGGFVAGKFLDSVTEMFSSKKTSLKSFESCAPQEGKETRIFNNFMVEETGKELSFYDEEGHKILVIEK